ncbi:FMN reductase [Actinacidiphila guanduensis]|uniref:FMN reductase n=1 Tax=Actinacidiphila guanduensis TaxID=310781 RepID=A0A1H0NMD6_9ACTN|nr:FMN reductase [Actinacidiphila guanduensis]
MATVLSLSGSPSPTSRTARLLRHLDARLAERGHTVLPLDARDLPAEALLGADFGHPAIVGARELFERADAVVVGTPVYKAAYSGLLKALLDVLPQHALAGKTVLPLATGGSTSHVLAIDYALRPVLSSMGAAHIVQGWFVLDRDLAAGPDGSLVIGEEAAQGLAQVLDQFATAVEAPRVRAAEVATGRRRARTVREAAREAPRDTPREASREALREATAPVPRPFRP